MKKIAILGSTGSIGTQALEVVRQNPDLFMVEVLTAHSNAEMLISQAIEFQPNAVVIGNKDCYGIVSEALKKYPVKVYAGAESICQIVEMDSIDTVLNALVGYAGLLPTLGAIQAKKTLALANKESLVVAGDLVMRKAHENRVMILPVDSEHSAIFQCLAGEDPAGVEGIVLTASGGPFHGKTRVHLETVGKEEALKHPNWKMGSKITIDSASMMNKGLEVIEAKWLFDLRPDQIEVVIHPQSVIHSMVRFRDGSVKAQMSLPDMRSPILHALGFPRRLQSDFPRLDFTVCTKLTFEKPDKELFRNLALAFEALDMGGNMPCVLNAANEIAVKAFLEEKISFLRMPQLIEKCLETVSYIAQPTFEDYENTNLETRQKAQEYLSLPYFKK